MFTTCCLLVCGLLSGFPPLDLPARASNAPKGMAFAQSLTDLSLTEREQRIQAEVLAGNVPDFLRNLVPISVESGKYRITYAVARDYLAVGADDDYFLVPLTPQTAQKIADRLGCSLPTTRMVDDIYEHATLKLSPSPIAPSPAMTTVPVFLKHHQTVLAQREGKPADALVAGHKKDVVISSKVLGTDEKVAIYGWHKLDGKPIQPLYSGHKSTWVDYSHGIRLVSRKVVVNGQETTIEAVLADPALAGLLSNEGVMTQTRYPTSPTPGKSALISAPGEVDEILDFEPGVRVRINRPSAKSSLPTLLIFYALPNGNNIEQTFGKTTKPGDDWHFDIQHIGAQTRFIRDKLKDRSIVVVYLENDLKSWPAWRRKHGDRRIPEILGAIQSRFNPETTRIALNGHSGGGSLIFGYLNSFDQIPEAVERIGFLDSNYAYDTAKHKEKLVHWIKQSPQHHLCILAYNDAVALLNGKPFVSKEGGTWGRSQVMKQDFEASIPLVETRSGDLTRLRSKEDQVEFYLLENPEKKIYHTVQVERNGFIESILFGTPHEGVGYAYWGERAYGSLIRPD